MHWEHLLRRGRQLTGQQATISVGRQGKRQSAGTDGQCVGAQGRVLEKNVVQIETQWTGGNWTARAEKCVSGREAAGKKEGRGWRARRGPHTWGAAQMAGMSESRELNKVTWRHLNTPLGKCGVNKVFSVVDRGDENNQICFSEGQLCLPGWPATSSHMPNNRSSCWVFLRNHEHPTTQFLSNAS